MKINWKKIKGMIIEPDKFYESCLPLEYSGLIIERVSSFKLLAVNTALRWNDHIDTIKSKSSKRLYFPQLLRLAPSPPTFFNIIKLSSALSLNMPAPFGIHLYLPSNLVHYRPSMVELFESLPLSNLTFEYTVIDEIFSPKNSTASIAIRIYSFIQTYITAKATLS